MKRSWCVLWLVAACAEEPPATPEPQELSGLVARVGSEGVSPATVSKIAAAQGISLEQARERAISDALFAEEAKQRLGDRALRHAESRSLVWRLLRELWAQARDEPITEQELAEATARNWLRFDRPKSYLAVHAVVQRGKGLSDEQARVVAAQMREAAVEAAQIARDQPLKRPPSSDEDPFTGPGEAESDPARVAFEKAVRDAAGKAPIRVEMLPPLAPDGTALMQGARPHNRSFDPTFSAATAALEQRGGLSEVVDTPFGQHVILLLDVISERRVPAVERREALRGEILERRAAERQRLLLQRLSAERGVEVVRNHPALLEQVRLGSSEEP